MKISMFFYLFLDFSFLDQDQLPKKSFFSEIFPFIYMNKIQFIILFNHLGIDDSLGWKYFDHWETSSRKFFIIIIICPMLSKLYARIVFMGEKLQKIWTYAQQNSIYKMCIFFN